MPSSPQLGTTQYPVIMTPEQVAEFLGVSVGFVTKLARKNEIPGAKKVGYLWRFNRDAILQWFEVNSSAEETQ